MSDPDEAVGAAGSRVIDPGKKAISSFPCSGIARKWALSAHSCGFHSCESDSQVRSPLHPREPSLFRFLAEAER